MQNTTARDSGAPDGLGRGRLRKRLTAIGLSFALGTALMALKFYVYRLTGSAAILSDALESIINVVASTFAMASIILAAKPPDDSHPYGHGKVEYFSAGFEGALIILAAAAIFWTGISHLITPRPLTHLGAGLYLLAGTAVVNLGLASYLIRMGRQTRSLALTADGRHILTDVYTSTGVLLGLILVKATGWLWLDGAIACAVGFNILVSGAGLLKESISGLMDRADARILDEISHLLNRHRRPCWIDIHRLRVQRAGSRVHIDFHLILPRDFTLARAHHEAKRLETIIVNHFDGEAGVLIHMDPCEDTECPVCKKDPCELRNHTLRREIPWSSRTLVMSEGRKRIWWEIGC